MIRRINNVLEPNCAQIYKRAILIIFVFCCFVNRSAISCYKEVLRWELSVDTYSWNKSFFYVTVCTCIWQFWFTHCLVCVMLLNSYKISDKITCAECFITMALIKPKNKCILYDVDCMVPTHLVIIQNLHSCS